MKPKTLDDTRFATVEEVVDIYLEPVSPLSPELLNQGTEGGVDMDAPIPVLNGILARHKGAFERLADL